MWGRMQVKQKMMFAMTRVGLKVRNQNANKFTDIKDSLRDETHQAMQTLIEFTRSAMETMREKRQIGGAPA